MERKVCVVCGAEMKRRDGEQSTGFKVRKTCGKECLVRLQTTKGVPDNKHCLACGTLFIRQEGENVARFSKRKACSHLCSNELTRRARCLPETLKRCVICGIDMRRHDNERSSGWLKRKTCSHKCGWILLSKTKTIVGIPGGPRDCIICGSPVERNPGETPGATLRRRTCSKECRGELTAQTRMTWTTFEKFCVVCGCALERRRNEASEGFRIRQACSRACAYQLRRKNRLDRIPEEVRVYSSVFTHSFRRSIRVRDGNVCQLCGATRGAVDLPVHHIDYDKHNCSERNLITLCLSCHNKTNFNRDRWRRFFTRLMQERELLEEAS